MRLFIAEKPSLGRAIAEGLGGGHKKNGYIDCGNNIVTWCFGHLLEMDPPDSYNPEYKFWKREDLPILPKTFRTSSRKDAADQLQIIGKLLKDSVSVVNAGDPDREGQLLVDEVLEYHHYSGPCERVWLASLDDKSVEKALASLKDNAQYAPLRDAARARSQADWLVGMNCTRAMTLVCRDAGAQGVLSLGRVQTPTLALVVARDMAIEQFVPHPYFTLQAGIQHPNGDFIAVFQPDVDTQAGLDDQGRLVNEDEAVRIKKLVSGQAGQIIETTKEKKKKNPPLPHSLSSLQKTMSAQYGMSAQQVLDIAQGLYEKKLTTYPRTDCRYLPVEQFADSSRIITSLAGGVSSLETLAKNAHSSIQNPVWNTKKVTAHHAIIPTGEISSSLSNEEMAVYLIIAQAYLVQFYPALEYEAQKILARIQDTVWKATGRKVLHAGWTAFLKEEKDEEEQKEANASLPDVKKDDDITVSGVNMQSKSTRPPARFTEGTLIEAMANVHKFIDDAAAKKTLKENEGIGTEATRANIIETLKKRDFLVLQKKNILSTATGRKLIQMAPSVLTDPVTTAKWESRLSAIADGGESLSEFMDAQFKNVPELVNAIFSLSLDIMPDSHPCPECGRALLRRKNKKGNWYWGCFNKESHASCEPVFLNDKKGKPAPPEPVKSCPECNQPMKQINTKKGPCLACFNENGHESGKPRFFKIK